MARRALAAARSSAGPGGCAGITRQPGGAAVLALQYQQQALKAMIDADGSDSSCWSQLCWRPKRRAQTHHSRAGQSFLRYASGGSGTRSSWGYRVPKAARPGQGRTQAIRSQLRRRLVGAELMTASASAQD